MDWAEARLSSNELSIITGSSQAKIRMWQNNGLYTPEQAAEGTGYLAKHSLRGALKIMVMNKLSRMGIKLAVARKIAKHYIDILDLIHDDYGELIMGPNDKFWIYTDSTGENSSVDPAVTTCWDDVIGINLQTLVTFILDQLENI